MYEKRVIAFAVSFFVIGVIWGISLNKGNIQALSTVFVISAIASIIILTIFAKHEKSKILKRITAAVIAVAALSFGVLSIFVKDALISTKDFDKKEDVVDIVITDISDAHIDGKIKESKIGVPINTVVRIYASEYKEDLYIGDRITCEIKYKFKNTNSLKAKAITLTASANINNIKRGSGFLYAIRRRVDENSETLFGDFDDAAAISKGVTIGDRTDISSYIFAIYRNSGISHLLAISGLHISIIVLNLYNFLLFLSFGRRYSSIISIIAAFVFAALTGFSISALRSSIMISAILLSGMFLEDLDPITTLFSTLFLFLIINPYSICGVGLQLSFICCLGLMLVSPLLYGISFDFSIKMLKARFFTRLCYKLVSIFAMPLLTSIVASVFSFPIIFLNFDTASSISPVINVLSVPMFTLAIVLAVIAYLIAPVSIIIAKLISYPAAFLFQCITNISEAVFESNIGIVSVHTPIFIIPLLLSLLVIAILMFANNKTRGIYSAIVCVIFVISVFVCGFVNKTNYNQTNIIEYGCNEGEYLFCSTEGRNVYVDIGGYTVNPSAIYETGTTRLDNYVLMKYSAYTYRHIDYMTTEIRVSNIVLPMPKNDADFYYEQRIILLANERKCDIIYYTDDYILDLSDDVSLEIIGQDDNIAENTSIYIGYGETSVQFLGDGFDNLAICDYAIVSDKSNVDFKEIEAKDIYLSEEYSEKEESDMFKHSTFRERLRFEINLEESSCRIYEP